MNRLKAWKPKIQLLGGDKVITKQYNNFTKRNMYKTKIKKPQANKNTLFATNSIQRSQIFYNLKFAKLLLK